MESQNSTFDHKMLVLEVFKKLSTDAQALVEIFLNYDCDFDSIDLFKRIVHALAKVAKGRAAADFQGNRRTEKEEVELRMLGLVSMVAILQSLVNSAEAEDQRKLPNNDVTRIGSPSKPPQPESDDEDEVEADEKPPTMSRTQSQTDRMAVVETFDRKQRLREDLHTGCIKFNVKHSAGVKWLVSRNQLEKTPRSVARFLHEQVNMLDKTMVGDYLGKEQHYQDGFCVNVLHEYVDMMDFSNSPIDEAIRQFLAGFRLPGEAQKIDRMMEKFAERYCILNKGVFPSADCAFILAFSIIMLNTDLHNPSIRDDRRMTKTGFHSQNRGIAAGQDLDAEFLHGVYDRIRAMPFSLNEDDALRKVAHG